MNKFRNNLHSAFLIEGFDGSYGHRPDEYEQDNQKGTLENFDESTKKRKTDRQAEEDRNLDQKQQKEQEAIAEMKQEENELLDNIIKDPDFSKTTRRFIEDKRKTTEDKEIFKEKKKKFEERLNTETSQGQKYSEVWNAKIKEGFDYLIKNLEDKKFFERYDKLSKRNKISEIKVNYFDRVKNEYTKIWNATDDKDFDEIKDIIFDVKAGNNNPSSRLLKDYIKQSPISQERRVSTSNAIEDDVKLEKEEEIDSQKVKDRIKFLANELPNYLREIRSRRIAKKGWSLPLGNVSIAKTIDRPSDEDRAGLENFIRAVDKLSGEEGTNIELKLIEVFKSLLSKGQLATSDEIKQKLEENKLSLQKDKYISKVRKAYDFYMDVMTVGNSVRDQHRIYLSVLDRITKQGGFDKTIAAYQEEVANYKKTIKEEKKGKGYEKGKILDKTEEAKALKAFADALNIAVVIDDKKLNKKMDKISYDYTRVTRLSEKPDDYFSKSNIVDILADLNNDGKIRPSDSGVTKTGTQFKEAYERAVRISEGNEEKVLENLFEHAKLYNSNLGDQKLDESEFTVDEIRNGNKKLILLLQSVIADPGQDFFTLLQYGSDSSERLGAMYEFLEAEYIPESPDDPEVQKAADEMISNGLSDEVASAEGLHQAVAGALFEGYTHAIGTGTRISFDKWVKGLAFNAGVQTGEGANGKPFLSLGLNLSYSKKFNVGKKGWSITPGTSIGFIPLVNGVDRDGNPVPFTAGAQVSAGVEIAKQWVDKNAEAQKAGGRISISYTNDLKKLKFNTLTGSYIMGWERNKLAGIEQSEGRMQNVFKEKIMTPLLDKIAEKFGDGDFDLTKEENIKHVNEAIDDIINTAAGEKKSEFSKKHEENIKKLKESLIRLLINYNKAPIANKNVRSYIANEMSERYAAAWTQQRIDYLDGKTYLSGARLGVSFWWFVGTKFCGLTLHAGLSSTKHEKDGYGDKLEKTYEIESISGDERNEENIQKYNNYLNPDAQLSLSEDGKYVVLSPKVIESYNILLNKKMKEHMKKDKSGNVLLSVESYINGPRIHQGTAAYSITILVGGRSDADTVEIKEIINDNSWFIGEDQEINTDDLPGKEVEFTREKVDAKLDELKAMLPNDTELQAYKFPDSLYTDQLKTGGKYKIILEKHNGEITMEVQNATKVKEPLKIEYVGKKNVELMDTTAQEIAEITYDAAQRVRTNALRNISHGNKRSEYVQFANQVKDKKYKEAKDTLVKFIPTMNKLINQEDVDFSKIINKLNAIEDDEIALGQALLSINNIFARVASVQGGGEKDTYHFRRYKGGNESVPTSMGSIIKERAGEIMRVIDKSPDIKEPSVKNGYKEVIKAMEKYRQEHPDYYKATSGKRKTLDNSVGINLGNGINVENPLFNPEIYDGSQISLKDLDFNGKDAIQERAMMVMAKDKSLMGPVLRDLGIDVSKDYSYSDPKYDAENGTLTIKINGEEVKFSATMSVGYFSQCVNHMILLEDVKAEIVGGRGDVSFRQEVSGPTSMAETTEQSQASTEKTGVDFAIGLKSWGAAAGGSGNGGTNLGGNVGGGNGGGGNSDGGGFSYGD